MIKSLQVAKRFSSNLACFNVYDSK